MSTRLRGLSGLDRVFQVCADGLTVDFPRLRTVEAASGNPSDGSDLLGRDRDVGEVKRRLGDRRLVTIVGPGGIGKTALARHVLRDIGFGGLVDLTSISTDDAVAGAVASQLGHRSFAALLAAPPPAFPVIIDNCEHVLGGAASTIDRLVDSTAGWTILATRRSPVNAINESIVALGPLAASSAAEMFLLVPRMRDRMSIRRSSRSFASCVCVSMAYRWRSRSPRHGHVP